MSKPTAYDMENVRLLYVEYLLKKEGMALRSDLKTKFDCTSKVAGKTIEKYCTELNSSCTQLKRFPLRAQVKKDTDGFQPVLQLDETAEQVLEYIESMFSENVEPSK